MFRVAFSIALGVTVATIAACGEAPAPVEPSLETDRAGISPAARTQGGPTAEAGTLERMMHAINDRLAARGAPYRVVEAELYTIGVGRPPVRIIQGGTRWVPGDPRRAANWTVAMDPEDVTYVVDVSDPSDELSSAAADPSIDAAFQTWSDVSHSYLDFEEIADNGANNDALDVFPNLPFDQLVVECSQGAFPPIMDPAWVGPAADAIVGGWLPRGYFDCLFPATDPGDAGGENTIGVTWTFSFQTDANNDGYVDTAFKEVYFNDFWNWVTSGTVFLDLSAVDLQTVAVHEFGHIAELGHMGDVIAGIENTRSLNAFLGFLNRRQIFSPVAIMNPGYLGGEFLELQPIDEAGVSTLFADGRGRRR